MALLELGDVTALLEAGAFSEGPQIEAKQGLRGFPRNGWETISAFANTAGGVIVLGLAEEGEGWRVEGVAAPDNVIQQFQLNMRNRQRISSEVADGSDIWTEVVEGRTLVVFRIRHASLRQKPIFLNGDPQAAFLRRGEADTRCTDYERERMSREASPSSFDTGVLPFLDEHDFDQEAIERYRQLSLQAKPNLPHHTREGREYLKSIGAWRSDRERGVEGPTRAGILVLGTKEAIGAIRDNHRIDYRRLSVLNPAANRYDERIEWDRNLFGAWEEIFPRLLRGLPVPFRLEGPQRIERYAGEDTLREAFVNLLVHSDYQEIDDAVITHRYDGYRFRNPGQSRVAVDHLGVDDASVRRNQKIAELFSHIGLADRAGSGYIRIFDEWPTLGYRRPQVTSDPINASFTLDLSLAAFIPSADRNWLDSFDERWREDEELALWLAQRQGRIDNQTLREHTGQHMSDASRTLVSLKNRDFLVSRGSGRNVFYVLGTKALPKIGQDRTDTDHLPPDTDHLDREPDHLPPDTDHLDREPDHLPPDTDHLSSQTDDLDLTLRYRHPDTLLQIALPLREVKKSPSREAMQEIMIRLCAVEPLSIAQLVDVTKRKRSTINRYVQELQESPARLRKAERIPGVRSDRYITVSTSALRQQQLLFPTDEQDMP